MITHVIAAASQFVPSEADRQAVAQLLRQRSLTGKLLPRRTPTSPPRWAPGSAFRHRLEGHADVCIVMSPDEPMAIHSEEQELPLAESRFMIEFGDCMVPDTILGDLLRDVSGVLGVQVSAFVTSL